jgi:hypothetical protein
VVPVRPEAGKPFVIKASDESDLPVAAGEYYFNTKARARRMMEVCLTSDAQRVYACLELHTMGFQQEMAVMMEHGRQIPLTPVVICRETGLSKQNVRRALAELEEWGLAERQAADGGALRNGQIQIYSWASPRPEKCKPKGSQDRLPFPKWFPESWSPLKPLIRKLKLTPHLESVREKVVGSDYLLEQGQAVAKVLLEAEKVVSEFLEGVCNGLPLNKEERTERTKDKDLSSSSSSDTELEPRPEPATTTAEPESPPWNEPETDPTPVIEATLQQHRFRLTRDEALEIIGACRDKLKDPAITPEETARFVYCVDPIRPDGGVISPRRFLKRAIVNAITRAELRFFRDASKPPPPPEPDEDKEMESTRCPKCGGVTTLYASGRMSWCRCEAMKRATR